MYFKSVWWMLAGTGLMTSPQKNGPRFESSSERDGLTGGFILTLRDFWLDFVAEDLQGLRELGLQPNRCSLWSLMLAKYDQVSNVIWACLEQSDAIIFSILFVMWSWSIWYACCFDKIPWFLVWAPQKFINIVLQSCNMSLPLCYVLPLLMLNILLSCMVYSQYPFNIMIVPGHNWGRYLWTSWLANSMLTFILWMGRLLVSGY